MLQNQKPENTKWEKKALWVRGILCVFIAATTLLLTQGTYSKYVTSWEVTGAVTAEDFIFELDGTPEVSDTSLTIKVKNNKDGKNNPEDIHYNVKVLDSKKEEITVNSASTDTTSVTVKTGDKETTDSTLQGTSVAEDTITISDLSPSSNYCVKITSTVPYVKTITINFVTTESLQRNAAPKPTESTKESTEEVPTQAKEATVKQEETTTKPSTETKSSTEESTTAETSEVVENSAEETSASEESVKETTKAEITTAESTDTTT